MDRTNPRWASVERPWRRFGATRRQWDDWRWQMSHRLICLEDLKRYFRLSPEEEKGARYAAKNFAFGITPYFASLMDPEDPNCPLRRQAMPRIEESYPAVIDSPDPLDEEAHSPVPAIIHRYPDRALFLASNVCSMYCRYCNRRRLVGDSRHAVTNAQWEEGIAYLEGRPEVRDVLISGGDPLTLSDERLIGLVSRLRAIPHVEILRIGTRVPITLPQRVTPRLLRGLRRLQPLYFSLHFIHPKEVTPEVERACQRLADCGFPLGSQTVLLAGINDDPKTMTALMQKLLQIRVRPYYLFQCDQVEGTAHFRTPLSTGLSLMENLIGHTSGYAVPSFVVDLTRGGGKIPLVPEYRQSQEGPRTVFRNFEGRVHPYQEG